MSTRQCGICGATLYDASDLVSHRQRKHPEEYQASKAKAAVTREVTKRARDALAQRQRDAVAAVDKPVVRTWGDGTWGDGSYEESLLSRCGYALHYARYPQPEAWASYQDCRERIAYLEKQAADALRLAFERGREIPQGDFDAIREVDVIAW